MSKVWRARDRESGRMVALKVLDGEQTRRFEARFPGLKKPTEGEVAVGLRHPNIAETYEHGLTKDGLQFLVMEFVEGYALSYYIETQNDVFKRHRLRLMIELGEAVAYVHGKNFIHRDVCPKNVIVTEDLHVKLIDFGLVVPNTPEFRRPGNRTGTANYMAPELIRRQPTDQRIDVFSYAVTCFEMCTGRLPWDSAKTLEAIVQHLNNPPADIRTYTPELDEEIAAVITRGLEVDRSRRWQSAREMANAFREIPVSIGPA
ncbi:MAG: serine/threonine protein kinase [Planctomycetota bacterium]|nr:serine/threonine protein kinase [Planctomycetota bacterium]